ncbi:MAG: tRNA (guanosine(37)-N1)-methyltransferase TrmD [Betaproteobacteria bacterium]|nr:tRNA (guanosine(37)-N1)-methyltransferase TrmD [Betaproteobacteria bacterium]
MSEAAENRVARFAVVTIFPEMFAALTDAGISRKALEAGLWSLSRWNPRDFADNPWRSVDDRPYGGGPGMVMQAEPLTRAIEAGKKSLFSAGAATSRVIYLSPQGRLLDHARVMELAGELAAGQGLVLLCGRYEGVDERLIELAVDEEISLGDFVLSGGELAAMALMDALIRQVPGALGDTASAAEDSFVEGLLDCPHYTRPEVFQGRGTPEVLLSGDHARIRRWRLKMSLARTRKRRPDLLRKRALSAEETQLLAEFLAEESVEQCGEH